MTSRIKKVSDKRLKELGGKTPFSTIRKKKRPASETVRIYGPPARRRWMKTLPCSACGVVGYSEGAHVLGNGGTGRKADADTQAPLCCPRLIRTYAIMACREEIYVGCHKMYDEFNEDFCKLFPDFDAAKAAAETQASWIVFRDQGEEK